MNNIFTEFILAARRQRPDDFSWLLPVAVFLIWIVGTIFKGIGNAREARKQQQRKRPESGGKMRYKPLVSEPSAEEKAAPAAVQRRMPHAASKPVRRQEPSTPAKSLRQVMQQALQEAYAQQLPETGPAPVRPVKARRPAKTPVRKPPEKAGKPVVEKPVSPEPVTEISPEFKGRGILTDLTRKDSLKKAIIYSEILGKPRALEN